MKLAELCDEDLQGIAMLKTRKGTATSEAKRAQQILRTRHITHGGFGVGPGAPISSHLDASPDHKRKTFEELNGCTLEEYTKK